MLRISKMTDYALVILTFLTKDPDQFAQASDIAKNTRVNKPTTAKLLKVLAKHGLLESYRGATGGYKLTRQPEQVSVAEIIQILEGPLGIMECTIGKECALSTNCSMHTQWQKINSVIYQALDTIKLSDLYTKNIGVAHDLKN